MDGRSATRVYPEFKELLCIFNAHNVKYLIVGGYAVGFHAQPRATKDLDILVKPDPENAKALYEALGEFGAPLEGLTVADFAEPGEFFRIGREPVMVDLLPEIAGVEFDAEANSIARTCLLPRKAKIRRRLKSRVRSISATR